MQTAKQMSVSLVNKPGRLADLLASLNKGRVDLRALSVMNSGERGIVRFVPDDFEAAALVLEQNNIRFEAADVLLVEISNQTGGFRKICEKLAAEHLNIDYAYSSFSGGEKRVLAVFKVNDLVKAQRILAENSTTRKRMTFRRLVVAH